MRDNYSIPVHKIRFNQVNQLSEILLLIIKDLPTSAFPNNPHNKSKPFKNLFIICRLITYLEKTAEPIIKIDIGNIINERRINNMPDIFRKSTFQEGAAYSQCVCYRKGKQSLYCCNVQPGYLLKGDTFVSISIKNERYQLAIQTSKRFSKRQGKCC